MTSRVLPPVAFGLALFLAWQAIVVVLQIPEYLLPSPAAILATVDRSLGLDFAVTFSRGAGGLHHCQCAGVRRRHLFVRFHTLEQGIFPSPLR